MAVPEHRRLQHEAVRAEGRAQRLLFAGECGRARGEFADAIELYRESYEIAPPGATGRLIGMLKASVIGAVAECGLVGYARERLRGEDDGPPRAYALAICDLIDGADEELPAHADGMRGGSPAFGRAATAIEALAQRSSRRYADAVGAIVEDFEGRRHHVTKVPIADTALMLEIFADRRGIAAHRPSPLLPTSCPDGAFAGTSAPQGSQGQSDKEEIRMHADLTARKQWALAHLEDIPDDHPPGWWDQEASTEGFGTRWHPVRRHLGIEGFGIAASGADAGRELIVPHHELGDGTPETDEDPYVHGQEEVYFLVRGRARFVLDGEEVELVAGDILFVPPHVYRAATALDDDTLVLGVGGAPGKPYQGLDPSTHLPDALPDSVAARRAGGGEGEA